jgi:short-subunit dehydrogenase
MNKPIALVTGATNGLGLAIAKALDQEGYQVYGTSRTPDAYKDSFSFQLLKLDLADRQIIDELVIELPEIDLLVNNAGYSHIGTVEETQIDRIEELFNVNLINQIYLTQKYIPSMRTKQKGSIINITSMAGSVPVPYSTLYASVKSAFDGFSKGLRNELSQFGINVTAVAPFQMNTNIPQEQGFESDSPYQPHISKAKKARDNALANAEDPEYIADQIISVLNESNPRPHIALGKGAWRKEWLIKYLPNKWVEKIAKKRFDLDY